MATSNERSAFDMDFYSINNEIARVELKLAQAFREAGPSNDPARITVFSGDAESKMQQVRTMTDRLEELKAARKLRQSRPGQRIEAFLPEGSPARKSADYSLGTRVLESGALRANGAEVNVPFSVEEKALFETGAGWAPQSVRSGHVQLAAERQPSVLDLLPVVDTEQNSYLYMEETTFTSGASEKAEAAQFGEGTLVLTEREIPIRKIPVFLPVSDEQIADERQARTYIDSRLGFMIFQRLDEQILVGDGISPNIEGFFETTGINTVAKGDDPLFDAIAKGLTAVRETGQAEPDAIVMNPSVWQDILLTRTVDGLYLMGSPAESNAKTLFGLPVITSSVVPTGKALVGAFRTHAALINRQGLEIRVSDSHSDYFIKGKVAIRAQVRVGLAVYRPAAFTEITGLDA